MASGGIVKSKIKEPEMILEDPKIITPALAFIDGKVIVGRNVRAVHYKAETNGHKQEQYEVEEPVFIVSDRGKIDMPQPKTGKHNEIIPLGKYHIRRRINELPKRWSIGSLNGFLCNTDGGPPDPCIVYRRIVETFKRWCYFYNDYNHDVIALHVLGSYFYPLWRSYPYVNLNGPKGTGKTTIGAVAQNIAFNGLQLVDPSAASLFRLIEGQMPYLVIDEAENVKSRNDAEGNHTLMSVLKAGYQRGALVSRQNQKSIDKTETFSVYCPKLICNVHGNEDILQDRSISIITSHAPAGSVDRNRPSDDDEVFQDLRDEMYLLLMHRHIELAKIIKERSVRIRHNRLGELVQPLLNLAYWVDGCREDGPVLKRIEIAISDQTDDRRYTNALTIESILRKACLRVLAGEEMREVAPCEIISEMDDLGASVTPIRIGKLLRSQGIIDPTSGVKRVSRDKRTYYLIERSRLESLHELV